MFSRLLPTFISDSRRFFWGTIAIFALRRHYAHEVRPYAERKGESRETIRHLAHVALDRHFTAAWPDDEESKA